MYHFLDDGKTPDQIPLDWFYGPVTILRIPKGPREEITPDDSHPHEAVLTPGARIIYETGWHRHGEGDDFFSDVPSLTQDAARDGCHRLSRAAIRDSS
jgi:arylformamidase